MRLHRIGSRPAKGVFGSLFGPSKRNSHAQRAKALCLLELLRSSRCDSDVRETNQLQERSSKTGLPRYRAAYFCLGKSKQNRLRRTRSAAIQPRRSPPLLGRRGTQPKLAALRHGLLYDPDALRCSARSTARVRSRAMQQHKQHRQLKPKNKRQNENPTAKSKAARQRGGAEVLR